MSVCRRINNILAVILLFMGVGCSSESLKRSDTPQTRIQAQRSVGVSLPESASEIYCLSYVGGLQDLEQFVRFDVPKADLEEAVESLIAENNKMMGRELIYPKSAISKVRHPELREQFLPMPWWTPASISNGYYRGHIDGYALRLFVDEENSRLYVYQGD